MTVARLIALLQKFPPDAGVLMDVEDMLVMTHPVLGEGLYQHEIGAIYADGRMSTEGDWSR